MQTCPTFSRQPSSIPGNIGTLNSRVDIWEHDPLWARTTQTLTWPFSDATIEQVPDKPINVQFVSNGAFLREIYKHQDMFICTINPNKISNSDMVGPLSHEEELEQVPETVDFVGSPESGVGQIAQSKLPGGRIFECDFSGNPGKSPTDECFDTRFISDPILLVQSVQIPVGDNTTGKSIFPHQVWEHVGNIFSPEILIHPSEYNEPLSKLQSVKGGKTTIERLAAAPKWDYVENNEEGRSTIWPTQTVKKTAEMLDTVHWTLRKWLPVWQGQDFFVTVRTADKDTPDPIDPQDGSSLALRPPYGPYMDYLGEKSSNFNFFSDFIPGISNEAFYVPPEKNDNNVITKEAEAKALETARSVYDWRYQTYILIEIGTYNANHNYFIELVKGRNPRFLHLGEEWDNPSRLQSKSDLNGNTSNFRFMRKCRVISTYNAISVNELFNRKEFRITVRNHLGRLIITFQGQERAPWVIERRDTNPKGKGREDKIPIPIVVPSAPISIHGGNISAVLNYSPLQYVSSGEVVFLDRQVDTGPFRPEDKAKQEDIYLTFSRSGVSAQYFNDEVRKRYFSDSRFRFEKFGYDCDSYIVSEIHKGKNDLMRIYRLYKEQYQKWGKGYYNLIPRTEKAWVVQRDKDTGLPLGSNLKNGMEPSPGGDPQKGGTPSKLTIFNARDRGSFFPLTLQQQTNYKWKDVVANWDVGVRLSAGTVRMFPSNGPLPIKKDGVKSVRFENVCTPIATSWRLILLGGGKPFEGQVTPFDISPLVSKINDSWSSEDFFSISHEMQIECYIPIESTSSTNPNTATADQANIYNLGRKLLSLHNKTFYITVRYWWDTGIGHRTVIGNSLNDNIKKHPRNNDLLIQMTGLAYGAKIQRSNNRIDLSFTVKDYMTILDKQFIFNSPFFDGVSDTQCIYDLAKLAGFADETPKDVGINRKPLGYLSKVLEDGDRNAERTFIYNGEKSRNERYDLPGSYADLARPSVKFQNGETYQAAMKRVAQLSSKAIYFDRWGVLRFETMPAIAAAFSSSDPKIREKYKPVFDFVSTPINRKGNIPGSGSNSQTKFSFDPKQHAAHLVYNTLTYQRSVEDCVNQIVLLSASNDLQDEEGKPTGGFVIEGYTFFDQLWDPTSEGFIGYRKPFYQANGVFGGVDQVRNGLAHYARMKFPPVIMEFETYGVPGLKALDIISLDGNLAYIREISHELDPAENRWWMNISAEWLKPFKGELGFLKATETSGGGQSTNGQ